MIRSYCTSLEYRQRVPRASSLRRPSRAGRNVSALPKGSRPASGVGFATVSAAVALQVTRRHPLIIPTAGKGSDGLDEGVSHWTVDGAVAALPAAWLGTDVIVPAHGILLAWERILLMFVVTDMVYFLIPARSTIPAFIILMSCRALISFWIDRITCGD